MTNREQIKFFLERLSEHNHRVFKLMYSPTDLNKDVNQIVDEIMDWRVPWALAQCKNSYYDLFKMIENP
jgi:DNA-binding HxlR family transcriptional regulator